MKLKTKVKTLVCLLSTLLASSYIFTAFTRAANTTGETSKTNTITANELLEDCNMADRLFDASGRTNDGFYLELKKCCELYDDFQICESERIATIPEIDYALKVAVRYFNRTNDSKFINLIEFYIREKQIRLDNPAGLSLLKSAILLDEGCHKFVNFLLEYCPANINGRDRENNTPLHIAVASSRHAIIRILLSHGADFSAVNVHGDTPYQIAEKNASYNPYHARTVEIFKKFFKKHHINL